MARKLIPTAKKVSKFALYIYKQPLTENFSEISTLVRRYYDGKL